MEEHQTSQRPIVPSIEDPAKRFEPLNLADFRIEERYAFFSGESD
jgi:hypothetical protein